MGTQAGPDILSTAMAALPGAVERAKIVGSSETEAGGGTDSAV